jgi:hypothetical protein
MMGLPINLNQAKAVLSNMPTNHTAAASNSFNMLVGAWRDYKTVQAVETTKRAQIQADKEVAIKAIEEQSALLRNYFEHVFAERKSIIQNNFALLEQALAQDNLQMASLAMDSINQLVQQSPLAQAKTMIASLTDTSVKHIEI